MRVPLLEAYYLEFHAGRRFLGWFRFHVWLMCLDTAFGIAAYQFFLCRFIEPLLLFIDRLAAFRNTSLSSR